MKSENLDEIIERRLREQGAVAAEPIVEPDENLRAWLVDHLREHPELMALALDDKEVRANAEEILGESVESALGLKSNNCRMRPSIDPACAVGADERRQVGNTNYLLYDCERLSAAQPIVRDAERPRFWIHYRESIT